MSHGQEMQLMLVNTFDSIWCPSLLMGMCFARVRQMNISRLEKEENIVTFQMNYCGRHCAVHKLLSGEAQVNLICYTLIVI